jgi:signal transduction histidine kinase
MTARVQKHRGELRIRTGRDGTRVHAVLPMDPADSKRPDTSPS